MSLGRTNYVTIADTTKFAELYDKYGHGFEVLTNDDHPGKVAFTGYGATDDGQIPGWIETILDEDVDTDVEETEDLIGELASCIADGEIMIYEWVASEKARHCSGGAVALDNTGRRVSVHTSEIYDRAAAHFDVESKAIGEAIY